VDAPDTTQPPLWARRNSHEDLAAMASLRAPGASRTGAKSEAQKATAGAQNHPDRLTK
jgi:hypothetical protein